MTQSGWGPGAPSFAATRKSEKRRSAMTPPYTSEWGTPKVELLVPPVSHPGASLHIE